MFPLLQISFRSFEHSQIPVASTSVVMASRNAGEGDGADAATFREPKPKEVVMRGWMTCMVCLAQLAQRRRVQPTSL